MSNRASQRLTIAEEHARKGHIAAAAEACENVLATDVDSALAHCLLGKLMLDEGFYEQAVSLATRAIELEVECAPAYLVLGLAYDRMGGMWARSVLVWQELAEVVPDLAVAQVQLGEALSAASLSDDATEAWNTALALDPRDVRAIYHLALADLKREGTAAALSGFRAAGELDTDQDRLFFTLAGFGEDSGPVADLAHIGPGVAERLEAAHAYAANEELFEAVELVRMVLSEHPEDVAALSLAAYLYLKQEAINEATACALRALTLQPETSSAILVLGAVFSRRPALAERAGRLLSTLCTLAPQQPLVLVLLGESELVSRRYTAAGEAFRQALALEAGNVRALFGDAAVALTRGDYTRASRAVREAAEYDIESTGHFWRLYDTVREADAQ